MSVLLGHCVAAKTLIIEASCHPVHLDHHLAEGSWPAVQRQQADPRHLHFDAFKTDTADQATCY